jgi:hypothetical protein
MELNLFTTSRITAMKKTIKLFIILIYCSSLIAKAQSFSEEMRILNNQNIEWFKNNAPNLIKKTPINIQEITPEQLSDSSKPTQQEIVELTKTIVHRNWYQTQTAKITNRYIKPKEAAQELINANENMLNSYNQATTRLVSGEISYGEYSKIKQKIISQNVTEVNKIATKYGLSK